jgi:hypothetical protein
MADQHSSKTVEARSFGVHPELKKEQLKVVDKFLKELSKDNNIALNIKGLVSIGIVIDPKTNEIVVSNCSHPEMEHVVEAFRLYTKLTGNLISDSVNIACHEVTGKRARFTELKSENTAAAVILKKGELKSFCLKF